jgi:hypothetical protein
MVYNLSMLADPTRLSSQVNLIMLRPKHTTYFNNLNKHKPN